MQLVVRSRSRRLLDASPRFIVKWNMRRVGLVVALALVTTTATTTSPRAASPRWELGAKAGYESPPIVGGTSPFGAGFGLRFGLSIVGLYVGASAVGYVGHTDIDIGNHAFLYGGEIGWGGDVGLGGGITMTIRPQLGVGYAALVHTDPALAKVDAISSASRSVSDSVTIDSYYLQPALVVMFASKSHFAALTSDMLVLPRVAFGGEPQTWRTFGLSAQIGFLF